MRTARYGRVIVSTSTAGLHGNHGMTSYSSAKAALIGLARVLALQGKPQGTQCNALAPFAKTPITAHYVTHELDAGCEANQSNWSIGCGRGVMSHQALYYLW